MSQKILNGNAKLTPIRGSRRAPSTAPVFLDAARKQVFGEFHCTHESCHKVFTTRARLRQHEFTHLSPTKRVKYACKLGCDLTFSNTSSRSRHQKMYCPNRVMKNIVVDDDDGESENQENHQAVIIDPHVPELEHQEEEYDGGGWDGDDGRFVFPSSSQNEIPQQKTVTTSNSPSEFICCKCTKSCFSLDLLAYCKQCETEFCQSCFDRHANNNAHTLVIGRPLNKQKQLFFSNTNTQEYTERIDTGAAIRQARRLQLEEDIARGDSAALRRQAQRAKWRFIPPSLPLPFDSSASSSSNTTPIVIDQSPDMNSSNTTPIVIDLIPPPSSPPLSFPSPVPFENITDTIALLTPKSIMKLLSD